MNKKTLAVLESILEDDAILSTMTSDQQAAIEEALEANHWKADYEKFLEDSISDAKRFLKAIKPKKPEPPKKPHNPKNDIKIGVVYDIPEGIVRTFSSSPDGIGYNSVGVPGKTNNFEGWVERGDLVEFPHSWNPKLPYEFDLYWDLKTCNDLRNHLWDEYFDTRFEENPQPPPFSHLLVYANDDLRDIIKDTKIHNQPLEQIMTKFEAAQKLHLKVFDYALPQQWVTEQDAKHGESPVPYFVWGYDNNKIFGEPVCLIPGKEYLSK